MAISTFGSERGIIFLILTWFVSLILLEKKKDIFNKRNLVQSFRFHPTLIVFYLKEFQFYNKF